MRFRLQLETFGGTLSFNYQYTLSSAIYGLIREQDGEYSTQLHDNKFKHPEKATTAKFCFSKLFDLKFKFVKGEKHMTIERCNPYLFVSVVNTKITDYLIKAFFVGQYINLNGLIFNIKGVSVLPEIELKPTMQLRAISPLFVRDTRGDEVSPDTESDFLESIVQNLINKYEVLNPPLSDYGTYDGAILSKPPYKNSLVWIKGISRKGYFIDFELSLDLPELFKVGFDSGFGSGNAQGFGYCVPVKV